MTNEQRAFFNTFYRDHFQSLVGYAYRFLKNWDDAKEITQEAFITGLVKIEQFYGSANQMGWIRQVIRKKASNLNHVRAVHAAVTVPLDEPDRHPSRCDHYPEVDSTLAHCAALLSAEELDLLTRIVLNQEPYSAAAKDFHCSAAACRKRMERILKKLRLHWDD